VSDWVDVTTGCPERTDRVRFAGGGGINRYLAARIESEIPYPRGENRSFAATNWFQHTRFFGKGLIQFVRVALDISPIIAHCVGIKGD
jgi:hypothetical protein